MNQLKHLLKWGTFFISVVTFLFVITEHNGLWDCLRCTNQLREVSAGMATSYQNAQRIFHPEDPQWRCLIGLIRQYSNAKFPKNKEPKAIGRLVAVASSKRNIGPNQLVEWTAPSTPILVIFKEWPGSEVGPEDYIIAGTIEDLANWIERDKNNFAFNVRDIFLLLLSLAIAFLSLLTEPGCEYPKSEIKKII